ncbi:MAG: Fe(3+) ABC transporter substrate-binding protein [Ectothiorhodospiraceae bacterium]|nr:Fe(3+) ABC transporter substrate-binding protein [Chromatiales bacterium]MCP5154779.1 Fe(3+) ABC transporter substrate-binding protein [Ectothiorhodospiraceae bacterium]
MSQSPVRRLAGALLLGVLAVPVSAAEVNVYSYRQPHLIQPILDEFSKETGIEVNVVHAKEGLVERLRHEGRNSPADLMLTVDIGRLVELVEADLVAPVQTPTLTADVPPQYRDPEGKWYGLTTRARVIITSKERVAEGAIQTYEDLADPRWKGKICTRSGKHDYMVGLFASMIAHHGEADARTWLEGVKSNLARRPQGNDRAQARAIKEGACDVAVINTYYIGNMLEDPEQKGWAEAVRVVYPNQADRGAHVNISGMALTKSAPNRDTAIRLMEFLTGDRAQQMYAERNVEYPVKPGVALAPLLASWGELKSDELALTEVARYRSAASKLVDIVGYDD